MQSQDYRHLDSPKIAPHKPTLHATKTKNLPLTFYLNLLLRMKSPTCKKVSLSHQRASQLKLSQANRYNNNQPSNNQLSNNQHKSNQLRLSQMLTLITIQTTTMAALAKIHPAMQALEMVATRRVLPSSEVSNTMRFVRTKKHPTASH